MSRQAAFMADMYGRLTQRVGVCLSTLGPGATNLTTGVANANMDRSPILAITAQTITDFLHKESHQNMDAVTMFKAITKWRWSIRNADSIPETIRRGFKIALEEKAGAVHLELPQDIAKMQSNIRPIDKQEVLRSRPNTNLIERSQNDLGGKNAFITYRKWLCKRKCRLLFKNVCKKNWNMFHEHIYG